MKFVVFASDFVGKEIVKFLSEINQPISCLVLDTQDRGSFNSEILDLFKSNNAQSDVLYSSDIYEERNLSLLKSLEPDLIILAWWAYIIKTPLIRIPNLGVLNFHPSYLPYNRGKNYNFWTIVEDTPFGVTIHWVNEDVDSGDIAFQEKIEKTWEDTGKTLYHKAQEGMINLFKKSFPDILNNSIPRIPQNLSEGSFHKANELDNASKIELEKAYNANELLNIMRARTFPPHPGAWFVSEDGEKFEIRIEISRCS